MRCHLKIALFLLCANLTAYSAAAQSSEGDLSLGKTVDTAPKIGQAYIGDTYGDWTLRCVKVETGQDPCQMYQLLNDTTGHSVAEILLTKLAQGRQAVAGATLITPLETLLTRQVTISIDDSSAKRYPFSVCRTNGCVARLGMTQQDIDTYKGGAMAKITIVPFSAPDQPVDLQLSLTGFTAAFDALN